MLEGYNGELTIIIPLLVREKQTKHTLFQRAMHILGHFFYISPSGDRTAILCGHLSQIIV